jgi:hypothetical protein
MCATVSIPGWAAHASASNSADESAPPEQATSVGAPAPSRPEPVRAPVSDRHDRTIAATAGSRRAGREIVAPDVMENGIVCARRSTEDPGRVTIMLWIVGVLVGAGAALVVVAAVVYFHERMSKASGEPPREEPSIERVSRDAEELSELLAARMEEKAAELEELLSEADRRIARLRKLTEEVQTEPKPRARVQRAEPARAADRADLLNEVYRLADSGRTIVEIARSINQPTGNVELILALRKV